MADAMAIESSPYTTRGTTYDIMPIPPIEENCHPVKAGPVTFVVESRALTADIVSGHVSQFDSTLGDHLEEDGGASLHVFGTDDGLEYLRFDCFEKQPHYHYVRQSEQLNQVCMIDDVAVNPIEWTMLCVRKRLAEMLDYAGAGDLAGKVRSVPDVIAGGLTRVDEMIERIAPVKVAA